MKHRVTIIAIGVLIAVAVAAYFARDWLSPGPTAVAGVKVDAKADAKAAPADGKGGAGKGGAGGPTPVEVVRLAPTVVKEDLQAVGSLRSKSGMSWVAAAEGAARPAAGAATGADRDSDVPGAGSAALAAVTPAASTVASSDSAMRIVLE